MDESLLEVLQSRSLARSPDMVPAAADRYALACCACIGPPNELVRKLKSIQQGGAPAVGVLRRQNSPTAGARPVGKQHVLVPSG